MQTNLHRYSYAVGALVEKRQKISSRRSAFKVHHMFIALFSWCPKYPGAENDVESEN